jgi:TonB-dependent SusC/RagA subfamily outer membrane receptor
MADINPADIERVEIIRGAAAAALYGSRANNGVVQIFTKRGRAGTPRVTLNSRYATNELRRRIPINDYPFDFAGDPVTRYDYQDQIFRQADLFDNTLSVEGGTELSRYFRAADGPRSKASWPARHPTARARAPTSRRKCTPSCASILARISFRRITTSR